MIPERRCARWIALWLTLLACGLATSLAQDAVRSTDPTPATLAPDYGRVGYLHIDGVIDRVRYRYLARALETAQTQNLDTLIVHLDTDGGEVYYAREMLKLILDQPSAGRRTIAFVDFRAISAGALIAYGHQALYIANLSSYREPRAASGSGTSAFGAA